MTTITMNALESLEVPRSSFSFDAKSFEIKVPASIANLGPGFDTLAVAVQLYLVLRVRKLAGHGELHFNFVDHALCGENRIERAYRCMAGESLGSLPSLSIEVSSEIPMRSGLGSSAAATVAGLRLYEAVTQPLPMETLLSAACALESHPDNAAASLLGGLTISCELPDGMVQATSSGWPESLAFVVVTPKLALTTEASRSALPQCVARGDVVFNLQRVALLLHALRTEDFSLLKHAMRDRVHQPAREKIAQGLREALELEHRDLLGVCLSGSGPSIVGVAEQNHQEIGRLLGSVYEGLGIEYTVRVLHAHQKVDEEPIPMFRAGLLCG
ncbi:MAG TPA: homoserine kinase [Terriglobales bacterium]|jgi:homoserine kinase|nr:homoserine kinase [Terriglobales bacterium]